MTTPIFRQAKIEALRAALKTSPAEVELPQKEKAFSVGFQWAKHFQSGRCGIILTLKS